MTSWSLIEDGPLIPQVPVKWARGQSPFPPVHPTWCTPYWAAGSPCPGNRAPWICSQQEPVSQEQTESRYSSLPSPPLDMCLTRTDPPPPPTSRPLCQPSPQGQDGRMRCGGQEGWEQPGERETLNACSLGRAEWQSAWGGGQFPHWICPSNPRGSLPTCI